MWRCKSSRASIQRQKQHETMKAYSDNSSIFSPWVQHPPKKIFIKWGYTEVTMVTSLLAKPRLETLLAKEKRTINFNLSENETLSVCCHWTLNRYITKIKLLPTQILPSYHEVLLVSGTFVGETMWSMFQIHSKPCDRFVKASEKWLRRFDPNTHTKYDLFVWKTPRGIKLNKKV